MKLRQVCAALVALVAATPITGARGTDVGGALRPSDIRQGLFGTCLASSTAGWVVGDLGRVYKTADGGVSWSRQEVAARRPFFSVSCVDAETAWLSSTQGRIYATRDGGAQWREQQTPVGRNLFKVVFATPLQGVAVGDFGIIVRTEDGGATWVEVGLPAEFSLPSEAEEQGVLANDALLYGLAFVDASTGWISGEWGTILKTEDGGRSWKQQASGTGSTLFGIAFADERRGVAVGLDATLLRTEDGGATWTALRSPLEERAYYEVALSGRIGWIAGNQGTILVSEDGGGSWRQVPTPKDLWSEWFRGVHLHGDDGFLVGGSGKIYALEGPEGRLLNPAHAAARAEG